MKKTRWFKLAALLLTGMMALLFMTGCETDSESVMKARVLNEINSYRSSRGLDELKEDQRLSYAQMALMQPFADYESVAVDDGTWNDAVDCFQDIVESQTEWEYTDSYGADYRGDDSMTLNAVYSSDASVLRKQIKNAGIFAEKSDQRIGIAFVTINGVTYWTASTYAPAE